MGHSKAPGISVFPILPPPGVLLGHAPSDHAQVLQWYVVDASKKGVERQKALIASGWKGALSYVQLDLFGFMRTLAKIAHGYAVFNVGLNGFVPLLKPLIRGVQY